MCVVCEQLGFNVHAQGLDGGQGDDGLDAPKKSLTTAQAAVYLNRTGASWEQSGGSPDLGTATTLTYAFRNTDAAYRNNDIEQGDPQGDPFSRFNVNQINMAQLALQSWADVANITFTRVGSGTAGAAYNDNAVILFGNAYGQETNDGGAYATPPYEGNRAFNSSQGDVWVNSASGVNLNPKIYNYGMNTLTHELGHALGLSHPGDYNGNGATYDEAYFKEDSRMYTVMSYWDESNTGGDFNGDYAAAPLLIDIAAMQRLYGVNLSFHTGDTTYGFNANASRAWYIAETDQAPIFCAWDAGGVDTFDFSGYAVKQTIDLRNEAFSDVGGYKSNVSIAAGVKVDGQIVNYIENAIGGSNKDTIIGNNADNRLEGRAGDDVLSAGKGDDVLLGGDGDDILAGSKGLDTFTGGLGSDTMAGAKNADTFIYQTLTDSVVGDEDLIQKGLDRLDKIDLSAIDAVTGSGNQAFHLGGASFTGSAGELIRFYHAGSDRTFIQGDVDGDGDADLSIIVEGDAHNFLNFVY